MNTYWPLWTILHVMCRLMLLGISQIRQQQENYSMILSLISIEFENHHFKKLQQYRWVKNSRTTPYHPMCNRMFERMNLTLLQMLRTLEETFKSKWKDEIKIMFAYNCTKHSDTGYSPYYLLFGRKPRLPVDFILKDQEEIEAEGRRYSDHVQMWENRMNEAYNMATRNTLSRRGQNKT